MNRFVSPYYPPRARWYSPFLGLWQMLHRRMNLDRLRLPDGISLAKFMASLLVPGLAFIVRKERVIGQAILLGYGLLAIIFIVWLGYPIANVAFGLMLAAHVSSISFLVQHWVTDARFGFRIATGVILLLLVGGGIYAPLRNELQTEFLMPLRINNHVVVVRTFSASRFVRRGDWIAYSLTSGGAAAVRVNEGLGLRPVLAVEGDRIQFMEQSFAINGVVQQSLPHMPKTGELVVPEKHWFLWPEVVISGHGNTPEASIASSMLQMAVVAETQFIGKPFKHWFWRRQILS